MNMVSLVRLGNAQICKSVTPGECFWNGAYEAFLALTRQRRLGLLITHFPESKRGKTESAAAYDLVSWIPSLLDWPPLVPAPSRWGQTRGILSHWSQSQALRPQNKTGKPHAVFFFFLN